MEGFGDAAQEMAKGFESREERARFTPGAELETIVNAMGSVGTIAAVALKGAEEAERAGNSECAARFLEILREAHPTWFDLAHSDRLMRGDFRFEVIGTARGKPGAGTFQIIFTGDTSIKHPELLLMEAIKKLRREWKEYWAALYP